MLKFLGLSNGTPSDKEVPAWNGVEKKHMALSIAISFALAVAVFFITHWLLSEVPAEGYVPYVPWNAAAIVFLLSIVITERGMLRNISRSESNK